MLWTGGRGDSEDTVRNRTRGDASQQNCSAAKGARRSAIKGDIFGTADDSSGQFDAVLPKIR